MDGITKQKRDDIDQASADSFPASDPPAWTNTTIDKKSEDDAETTKAKDKRKMKDSNQGSCGC